MYGGLLGMHTAPFVSIVLPIYNGASFLSECIKSALSQSYENFEIVALDNASTDETREILNEFASKDRRIRILANSETLPVIQNWNRAISAAATESRYIKILHADDTLYPNCLEKMLGVANRNPAVGVVGSVRHRGSSLECLGLPTTQEAFDGRLVARAFLRQEKFVLAPSSSLFRADLVRERRPFYPEDLLHADIAACLAILFGSDFGFVHEVLTFSRIHSHSITAKIAEERQTLAREWLTLLRQFGPRFMPTQEVDQLTHRHLLRCHRMLVRAFVTGRGRSFLEFHLDGMRTAGFSPRMTDYARAVALDAAAMIRHPRKLLRFLQQHDLPS